MQWEPDSIFLCYRRRDAGSVCGRIYDRLVEKFGRTAVFRDIDSIPLGEDIREFIQRRLARARVGLVLIGPSWVEMRGADGQRLLHRDDDHVRVEIEAMLARSGMKLIPLFVGQPPALDAAPLPASLGPLFSRLGHSIRDDPDFHPDMDRLIQKLQASSPPVAEPALPVAPAPRTTDDWF